MTLLERDEPAHERSASGALTRVLRFEYGERGLYSAVTVRALARWRELERESGEVLFVPQGMLHMATGAGEWELASQRTVSALGIATELLEPDEVVRRWPAFRPEGISFALYSPEGGYLWARRATAALARRALAAGVRVRTGARVIEAGAGRVALASGELLGADVVVLCTGAWSGGLEPRLRVIVPRRQATAYFDAEVPDIPVFGDGGLDFYGFPSHAGLGPKVGWHRTVTGEVADPADPAAREVTEVDLAPLCLFAATRLGLESARVTTADICFYAMTPDEHPIVDRLDDHTVVCAGFSGHGFKFAPVVGEAAAELALGLEPSVELAELRADRDALHA